MDIFVSYAREDRDRARLLASALERRGWSVFWDTDILPGDSFREVIGEKLAAAGCVLVLWSSHSVDSRWVLDEAREGLERGVLVPVMSEEVDIPLGFGGQQTADLTHWRGDDEHPGFQQIVSAVARRLGVPEQPGQQPSPGVVASDESNFIEASNRQRWRVPRKWRRLGYAVVGVLTAAAAVLVFVAQSSRCDISEPSVLEGKDLHGCDLRNADLSGANLSFAILEDADLTNADLTDADLRNADLTFANLISANLIGADLSNADLRNALWGGTVCPDGSVSNVACQMP